jgi:hypothetical protein
MTVSAVRVMLPGILSSHAPRRMRRGVRQTRCPSPMNSVLLMETRPPRLPLQESPVGSCHRGGTFCSWTCATRHMVDSLDGGVLRSFNCPRSFRCQSSAGGRWHPAALQAQWGVRVELYPPYRGPRADFWLPAALFGRHPLHFPTGIHRRGSSRLAGHREPFLLCEEDQNPSKHPA